MKFCICLLITIFSSVANGQIHTNPGGGPDPYNDKRRIPECPELDPVVFVFEDSFVREYKIKHKISETNFFPLIEKISLEEMIKQLPFISKGPFNYSCSEDEKESLMQIYQMYKTAAEQDKVCENYLKLTTNKLRLLEDILKINGKK